MALKEATWTGESLSIRAIDSSIFAGLPAPISINLQSKPRFTGHKKVRQKPELALFAKGKVFW